MTVTRHCALSVDDVRNTKLIARYQVKPFTRPLAAIKQVYTLVHVEVACQQVNTHGRVIIELR